MAKHTISNHPKNPTSSIFVFTTILMVNSVYCTPIVNKIRNTVNVCANIQYGRFRDITDCRFFISCWQGSARQLKCPVGQRFNSTTKECQPNHLVNCQIKQAIKPLQFDSNVFNCLGRFNGYYPDPFMCTRYYVCFAGRTISKPCPTGLHFNAKVNVCDWPKLAGCDKSISIISPYRPNPITYKPYATTRNPIFPIWVRPVTYPKPVYPTFRPVTQYPPPVQPSSSGCQRIVCYFTNWAQYRRGAKQLPEDIDPTLCTHVIFAFATMSGNKLSPFEWNDMSTSWSKGNYEKVLKHKQTNPKLKVLLAVGGWNMGVTPFSKMVSTASNRNEFVTTTVSFLRRIGFDGLDIDWEYPANRGSPSIDRNLYSQLLRELKQAFLREAAQTGRERLMLTAAVAAGQSIIDSAYEIPVLNAEVDFINLMAYDLHGSWEVVTGHHSSLYSSDNLNVDFSARHWAQNGMDRSKIVLGIPLYGRSFTLASPASAGVGAAVTRAGTAGKYTQSAGMLSYYEVCQMIQQGGRKNYVSGTRGPYVTIGNQWVGYDDIQSVREKVNYARQNQYGGVMVWDISFDDFKGQFCNEGKYPLLNAIKNQCSA